MSTYQELINSLHKLQRNDPYVKNMLEAISKQIDKAEESVTDFDRQYWYDTMTWYVDELAKLEGIKLSDTLPIEEKRSITEARWKSSGKSDIYLLQAVADSWKNGEVEIDFLNGKIQVEFVSTFGVPATLDNLKLALEGAKPAHLAVMYLIKYFLICDVEEMTLGELENQTLDKFAF